MLLQWLRSALGHCRSYLTCGTPCWHDMACKLVRKRRVQTIRRPSLFVVRCMTHVATESHVAMLCRNQRCGARPRVCGGGRALRHSYPPQAIALVFCFARSIRCIAAIRASPSALRCAAPAWLPLGRTVGHVWRGTALRRRSKKWSQDMTFWCAVVPLGRTVAPALHSLAAAARRGSEYSLVGRALPLALRAAPPPRRSTPPLPLARRLPLPSACTLVAVPEPVLPSVRQRGVSTRGLRCAVRHGTGPPTARCDRRRTAVLEYSRAGFREDRVGDGRAELRCDPRRRRRHHHRARRLGRGGARCSAQHATDCSLSCNVHHTPVRSCALHNAVPAQRRRRPSAMRRATLRTRAATCIALAKARLQPRWSAPAAARPPIAAAAATQ